MAEKSISRKWIGVEFVTEIKFWFGRLVAAIGSLYCAAIGWTHAYCVQSRAKKKHRHNTCVIFAVVHSNINVGFRAVDRLL